MGGDNGIRSLVDDMRRWRHQIHAHPELAFQEVETARLVADRLREFGLDVHENIARTGVVGTLSKGDGPAISLRADMDALPIQEHNDFAHRSRLPGKMHACGHDGHTAMLLGAAAYLARAGRFRGTVHFIFQPAEENEGGGRAMIEAGLFDRFPADAVFGMHNWPGLDLGKIAVRSGPVMAAFDTFEITLTGQATHAAMPQLGRDVMVAAGHLITALQSIVSRNMDPIETAVVSITQLQGGETWNAIPDRVVLRGCTRHFLPQVQDMIEQRIGEIAEGVAAMLGVTAEVSYRRCYPATINSHHETQQAIAAASAAAGANNIVINPPPSMGSEDFAFLLQERPGCYVWLGNGSAAGGCLLHNPDYDFNDEALGVGLRYWIALVEQTLPLRP